MQKDLIKSLKKYKKELIYLKVEEIIPYENNNKIHTDESVNGIEASMGKVGYIAPIIVDEENVIIAGHGRLLSVKRFQEEEIDVIRVYKMPEKEKKIYRIADNTTNLLSGYDLEAIRREVMEIGEDAFEFIDHLEGMDALNFFEEEEYDESIEDEVPVIDEKDIQVQAGDFFRLGNHYMLCGDSTKKEDVAKLMQGNMADMVFTDPPYNVNYKGQGENTSRGIANDHMGDENFRVFLLDVFKRYQEITKEDAGVYIFHSSSTQSVFQETLEANNFQIKNQLIWNKPSAALGWGDYRWKHEPFFYCGLNGTKNKFYGDRTHGTVIETLQGKSDEQILKIIKRARKAESEGKGTLWSLKRDNVHAYVHPTQKPIELIEYALKNSSKRGNIVIDLFGGSGSTMVACEKKGRVNYTMELDPYFVQVVIKRFFDVTKGSQEIECLNRDFDFSFLEK